MQESLLNQAKLTNSLRNLSQELSDKSSVTFGHALHEILAITSFCSSGTHKIMHSFVKKELFLNNFYILIAESGSGKSTVRNELLEVWNKELKVMYKNYKDKKLQYDEFIKKNKNSEKVDVYNKERVNKPIVPYLFLSDVTKEALVLTIAKEENPMLGIWNAEGALFFNSMGMHKENKTKMIALLNSLWSNETSESTTVKDGSQYISGAMPLSLNLALQENVFERHVCTKENEEIGFSSRLLVHKPKFRIRLWDSMNLAKNYEKLEEFKERIAVVLRNTVMNYEKNAENNYTVFELEEELEEELKLYLKEFFNALLVALGKGERYEAVKPFVSKSDVHVLRLAAAVRWLDPLTDNIIRKEHLECAIEIYKWYLNTHVKIMKPESYNADKEEDYKMKVKEWFKKRRGQQILFREVLRTILRYIPKHLHNKLIEELDEENIIMDMRSLGQVMNIDGVRSKKWVYVLKEGEVRIGEAFDWGDEEKELQLRVEAEELDYKDILAKFDDMTLDEKLKVRLALL